MVAELTQPARASLLGLPVELRLKIFRLIWRSLVIEVKRGAARYASESDSESDEDADADYEEPEMSRSCDISPLPGTPSDVAALRRACKRFSHEIDDSWHSEVTYRFPTTVSFIDVLSQWSKEKVCKLRYAYVVDYPLPVYAFDEGGYFMTLDFSDALPMFPGLQLELLSVENIWLTANGEPPDTWCFSATVGTVKALLLSSGWRRLEYHSGILPLTPTQMSQLDMAVEKYKTERAELDFRYGLGRVRPHTHSHGNLLDFKLPDEDYGVTLQLVMEWYTKHADEKKACGMNKYPEGVTRKHVAMWAERGSEADYVQSGLGLAPTLASFEGKLSWVELRKTDDYLTGDGAHDPTSYL
ncbi:uncharacterized protein RCC_09529 [Ramularia collo-cygni]|uniref:F-box domain-containing protein n=1 Tax=Ramularia collo-cygni TaxID=112498 RepID=A0A2D3VDH3_9PEZI|nr:uncharacterized protein RCC_09529 [Ramularia collo-cygni]CZT23815.1 uncharacterized protein RCC_09529 [Ramularia collo-cygni]